MFSHIMIGTNDLDRAKSFYDALLGTLGVPPAMVDGNRIFYMTPTGIFSVSKPIDGEPATVANGKNCWHLRRMSPWISSATTST